MITSEELLGIAAMAMDLEAKGLKLIPHAMRKAVGLLEPVARGESVIMPNEADDEMIAAALKSTAYHHNFEAQYKLDRKGKHTSGLDVNREKMRVRYRAMAKVKAWKTQLGS